MAKKTFSLTVYVFLLSLDFKWRIFAFLIANIHFFFNCSPVFFFYIKSEIIYFEADLQNTCIYNMCINHQILDFSVKFLFQWISKFKFLLLLLILLSNHLKSEQILNLHNGENDYILQTLMLWLLFQRIKKKDCFLPLIIFKH